MSEYQYYEFLAMDRPLDEREMAELRGISTRADITPTHFSNEYNYGDLKADPAKLLERYFDVSAAEQPEPEGMAKWIARLPQKEKDALLLRVAQGEHAHVAAALVRRFRKEMLQRGSGPPPQRRTVAELLGRADELREAELRRQARAAAEARRKREAAAAATKAKRLDALAARKPAAWRDVRQLVDSKKPKSYDEAVTILRDLRDLAVRENNEMDFTGRLHELRDDHARKPSFLARLDKAKLR